jgi:type II secretory pathway pseudopilin PulG
MRQARGLTLAEVLVAMVLLGAIIALLVVAIPGAMERNRRERCRRNLNRFAEGMASYLRWGYGDRLLPWPGGRPGCGGEYQKADFGGAEWLAALYWTRHLADPAVFICPSSGDTNRDGQ